MNLSSIGKTLAGQAIETTKNTVLDALKPAEPARAAQPAAETAGSALLAQITAMQRPLGEDQELAVYIATGSELLRALEIFVPNSHVLVFAGYDTQGAVTRVIAPSNHAQVMCKVIKVQPGARPARINILTPKPKPAAAPSAGSSAPQG